MLSFHSLTPGPVICHIWHTQMCERSIRAHTLVHTNRRWLTLIQTRLSANQSSSLNKVRINNYSLISACLSVCAPGDLKYPTLTFFTGAKLRSEVTGHHICVQENNGAVKTQYITLTFLSLNSAYIPPSLSHIYTHHFTSSLQDVHYSSCLYTNAHKND